MSIPEEIFLGCLTKDRKSQEKIFELCYSESLKIALRYTRSMDDAKDVVNQAFFKIFTKIEDFKGNHTNCFAWVKRILINQSLDYLKQNNKNKTWDIDSAFEVIDEGETVPFEHNSIIHLIQKLPELPRKIFNLFAIDGYSHKEIAQICNITESNSKYHVHAARKLLKEMYFKMELP